MDYCNNDDCFEYIPCTKHGILLVLDLDHTLIHSPDDCSETYFRPNVEQFLIKMQKLYKIMIWTAACESYAKPIIKKIFKDLDPPLHVFTRKECTQHRIYDGMTSYDTFYIKKLSKIKDYDINRIIIIDDTPETYMKNYGNAIPIKKWYYGDDSDIELLIIGNKLTELSELTCSVRSMNKSYEPKVLSES